MLFILEGPDGAGKSTLANKIWQFFEDLQGPYVDIEIHKHGVYKDMQDIHMFYLKSIFRTWHKHVIMDRCWISEVVYSKHVRKVPSRLNDIDIRMLEETAHAAGVIYIICLPPIDVCYENYKGKIADEYIQDHKVWQAVYNQYYVNYFESGKQPRNYIFFDYTKNDNNIELLIDCCHKLNSKGDQRNGNT